MCAAVGKPNNARRRELAAPRRGPSGGRRGCGGGGAALTQSKTTRPDVCLPSPRAINHISSAASLKKTKNGALKVKQTGGKQRRVKGTKDSAQLVAFSLSRGRRAIVTSGRGSWIATVVTLRLVNGLRLKGFELNVGAQAASY